MSDRAIVAETGFFATGDCLSGHHCRTCRNWEHGRSFREAIARGFHLADKDFCCPRGRPVGSCGTST